jgi:hypothetical protein
MKTIKQPAGVGLLVAMLQSAWAQESCKMVRTAEIGWADIATIGVAMTSAKAYNRPAEAAHENAQDTDNSLSR